MDNIFLNILAIIFLLIGVIMTILMKVVYVSVKGLCISVDVTSLNAAGINYKKTCSTYDYEFKGKKYRYKEKWYSGSKKRKEGQTYTLYVNPKNHGKCFTPTHIENVRVLYIAAILLILL